VQEEWALLGLPSRLEFYVIHYVEPLESNLFPHYLSQMNFNIMSLLYVWVSKISFLGHLLGVSKLVRERNKSVRDKLSVQNIVREIEEYQQKWLQHLQRMDKNRIPKQALQ
jgi:hypothetical protein